VGQEQFLKQATGQIYTGADTIGADIGLLPKGRDVYGSYVDNYGGFPELLAWAQGSGAQCWSITIFGNRAMFGDFQRGAMVNGDFPHWYDAVADRSLGIPGGYTSASNMAALISASGGRPFWRWSAHYGHGPHICGPSTCGYPQVHWTQWADVGPSGQNCDQSLGTVLPGAPTPPSPPSPKGTSMIASGKNQDGRQEVFAALQSGEIKHIWQTATSGAWNGSPGVTPYFWADLGNVGGTPVGISVDMNFSNCLEVFVRLSDGSAVHCWQNAPGGTWHGSQPGSNATWEPLGNPGS
jgi:hypothetical protein